MKKATAWALLLIGFWAIVLAFCFVIYYDPGSLIGLVICVAIAVVMTWALNEVQK